MIGDQHREAKEDVTTGKAIVADGGFWDEGAVPRPARAVSTCVGYGGGTPHATCRDHDPTTKNRQATTSA